MIVLMKSEGKEGSRVRQDCELTYRMTEMLIGWWIEGGGDDHSLRMMVV
jgi:hypothetical protein